MSELFLSFPLSAVNCLHGQVKNVCPPNVDQIEDLEGGGYLVWDMCFDCGQVRSTLFRDSEKVESSWHSLGRAMRNRYEPIPLDYKRIFGTSDMSSSVFDDLLPHAPKVVLPPEQLFEQAPAGNPIECNVVQEELFPPKEMRRKTMSPKEWEEEKDRLKRKIQERLAQRVLEKRFVPQDPPRYDEVFEEGVRAMDGEDRDPIPLEGRIFYMSDQPPTQPIWEYKTLGRVHPISETFLNDLGKEGWEVIKISDLGEDPHMRGYPRAVVYLKRLKPRDPVLG